GLVETPFIAMMDSDDWYTDEGLAVLMRHWNALPDCEQKIFASVEGRTILPDGNPVTSPFPSDIFDSDALSIRAVHGISGDTMGVHRTDVLTAYPFPEHEGYVTEALIWNRIAARYKTRFVNDVVALKESRRGGISDWPVAKAIAAASGFQQLNEALLGMPMRSPIKYPLRAYV